MAPECSMFDHVPYVEGKSDHSACDKIFYCSESKITAACMGPWKFHFSTHPGD